MGKCSTALDTWGYNYIWCTYLAKNDFTNALIIAFILILIQLGSFLIRLPLNSVYAQSGQQLRNERRQLAEQNRSETVKYSIKHIQKQTDELIKQNNFLGWNYYQYNYICLFQTLLQLIVKIILVTDEYVQGDDLPWYVKYHKVSWSEWCNGNTIITTFLFTYSIIESFGNMNHNTVWMRIHKNGNNQFIVFTSLIYLMDPLVTFILLCVVPHFFAFYLYWIVVSIIVLSLMLCTLCFWFPCFIPVHLILRVAMHLTFCLKKDVVAIQQVINGCSSITWVFFTYTLIIVFVWLINGVNCPKSYIVFSNYDKKMIVIAIIIFIQFLLGLVAVYGGVIKSILGKSPSVNTGYQKANSPNNDNLDDDDKVFQETEPLVDVDDDNDIQV